MADDTDHLLSGPFVSEGGKAWRIPVPDALRDRPGNSLTHAFQSRLLLLEDGRPVAGDRHAQLTDIREQGAGAYNHWHDDLLFSSSDGTDPNQAVHRYSLRETGSAPRVLALGSCHVARVLTAAAARGWIEPILPYALTYNTRDALDLIAEIRGLRTASAGLPRDLVAAQGHDLTASDLTGLDGVALEISSGLVTEFRGESLLRVGLYNRVVAPILAIDEAVGRIAHQWLRHGLLDARDTVRAETAAKVIDSLGDDPRIEPFVFDILREARTTEQSPQAIADGVAAILAAVAAPAAMFLHVVRFMPDGRPLTWPRGFHDLLREIAAGAGMAVIDPPATMAAQPPGTVLLEDDLRYSRAMLDAMARETVLGLGLTTDPA